MAGKIRGLMEQDNMDNLGFKDVADPQPSGSTNAAANRSASQGPSAQNRQDGAGAPNAKAPATEQSASYADQSQGRSGIGRLI